MQLISINEAALLTGKSVQTIRRMIKQKKVQAKKQKTSQGFNYLVYKNSIAHLLAEIEGLTSQMTSHPTNQTSLTSQATSREHAGLERKREDDFRKEVTQFNSTLTRLIEQHEHDKTNLFDLIKKFQDRIVSLESEIKLLEAPKPRWWQFWR